MKSHGIIYQESWYYVLDARYYVLDAQYYVLEFRLCRISGYELDLANTPYLSCS